MTYTSVPQDEAEGYLLWVKVSLAVLAGVVVPLLQPYPYVPLDPKVCIPVLHSALAEQNYSIHKRS
jgi:hypothetical protein